MPNNLFRVHFQLKNHFNCERFARGLLIATQKIVGEPQQILFFFYICEKKLCSV